MQQSGTVAGEPEQKRGFRQWLRLKIAYLKGTAQTNSFVRFVKHILADWTRDDASDRAGALAYYAFISIFPLLLGVVSILGFFLPNMDVRQAVTDALTRLLPGSVDLIQQNLDAVIEARGVTGLIGIVGLLWSGTNLFTAIRRAMNRAWGVKQERRFIVGKTWDLALVFGTGILFLASFGLVNLVAILGETGRPVIDMLIAIGSRLGGFILSIGIFLIIYKWVPNTRTLWRWTWPGAVIAAALFQLATYIFLFFLANFANYESVYGPLGSVVVLLLWIYISSIILILGVEINSELHHESIGMEKSEMKARRGRMVE